MDIFDWVDGNKRPPQWFRALREELQNNYDTGKMHGYEEGFHHGCQLVNETSVIVNAAERFALDRSTASLDRLLRAVEAMENKRATLAKGA